MREEGDDDGDNNESDVAHDHAEEELDESDYERMVDEETKKTLGKTSQ